MAEEIVAFGEAALMLRFDERIDEHINRRVHAVAERLRQGGHAGLGQPVAGYASLLVAFDPDEIGAADAERRLREAMAEVGEPAAGHPRVAAEERPPLEISVRYGGADGPDLDAVAELVGLSPADVVDLHASVVYRAYMLGFAPGFAYLGELPAALELPRRATPRERVAAGSVAIAARQTAVYPLPTPGGWHLLGRTDAALWDVRRDPPALITPGRRVRFVPA